MPAPTKKTPLTADVLNSVSTLRTVQVAVSPITDNGRIRIQLPQAGLGKRLFITVDALVTLNPTATMTVTGGTWGGPPNYAPFTLFRNVTLSTNNGIQYVNASGYSLYMLERFRTGIDPLKQEFARFTAGNSANAGNFTGLNTNIAATTPVYYGTYGDLAIPTSSGAVAVTFPIRFTMVLDLTYNNRGDVGYVVLQQNNVFTTLELTIGNMCSGITATGGTTDLFNALTGTNIASAVLSGNVYVDMEYRDVPDLSKFDISTQLSAFRSVLESTQPLVNGKNIVKIPQQDFVTMAMLNVWNNSDALPLASMQNLTLGHSNNIAVHQQTPQTMLAKTLRDNQLTMPDGSALWDFGQSNGLIMQRDVNDALDNRFIVNAQVEFTVPSSVTVTSQPTSGVTLITEALRPVQQA